MTFRYSSTLMRNSGIQNVNPNKDRLRSPTALLTDRCVLTLYSHRLCRRVCGAGCALPLTAPKTRGLALGMGYAPNVLGRRPNEGHSP
jgi:hypothetical protein